MNVSLMFIFSGNFQFETGLLHCKYTEFHRIIRSVFTFPFRSLFCLCLPASLLLVCMEA